MPNKNYEDIFRQWEGEPKPPPAPIKPVQAGSKEDFDVFYQEKILPAAGGLEADRLARRTRRINQIWIIGTVVLATVPVAAYTGWWFIPVIGALLGAIAYVAFSWSDDKINEQYKTDVAPLLVAWACGPDAQYAPDKGFSGSEFQVIGLWPKPLSHYWSTDGVSGRKGKTWFRFCEAQAKHEYRETYFDSQGRLRSRTHTEELFRGVLFQADFKKEFKGTVLVTRGNHNFNMPEVRMDHQRFNDTYYVYSYDAVQAHYLLTPDVMEEMLALNESMDGDVEFSFVNGTLYIAHNTPEDELEASVWGSVADPEKLYRAAQYLQKWAGIVERLDLNVRIWSKA